MALKKSTSFRGYQAEYWMVSKEVYDKEQDKTACHLRCFKDKATREADIRNYIPELTREFSFDGKLTTPEMYAKIKESNKQSFVTTQYVPAVLDEQGNEITPAVDEVVSLVETNFFANAEDA